MANLPVPQFCLVDERPEFSTVACHKAMRCQRCGYCLNHCRCVASVPTETPMPKKKQKPEPEPMLCEVPNLKYDYTR